MYMYAGQMHVLNGQYRQFACKHCVLKLEETNSHSKCVASPRFTTPSQHGVTGSRQLHAVNLVFCNIIVLGHVTVSMALLYKGVC